MKNILTVLFLSLFSISCYSQTDSITSGRHRFIHLGIVPPLSTNGKEAKSFTNNLSLHLLWGESQNERGLSVSGIANKARNSAYGVHIAGLVNRIGYDINGSWPADLNNYSGGDGKGLAIAGLGNTAYNYDGVMISLFNRAAILNGIQIGLGNGTNKLNGLQIGMVNGTSDGKGIQIGMGNLADSISGIQIGIFNERKKSGFQIGIVNIAEHNDWPIGILNLISDGEKKVGISVDEIASTVISYRSGGRYLYGIVGAGYNFKSNHNHMVIEAGIGAHIHLSEKFRIDNEIIWNGLTVPDIKGSSNDDDKDNDHNFKLLNKFTYRLLPVFKCGNRIEIFGGPTINYMQTNYTNNKKIFPSSHLWRKFDEKTLKQAHIGWVVGIQYVL